MSNYDNYSLKISKINHKVVENENDIEIFIDKNSYVTMFNNELKNGYGLHPSIFYLAAENCLTESDRFSLRKSTTD